MTHTGEVFCGIDVGTSGVKVILVDQTGAVVERASVALTMHTPHPGWAEQEPEAWWAATVTAVQRVLAAAPGRTVVSIGVSGQMHSSVFLDKHGNVIHPALLWCDGRTTAECADITRAAGGESMLREWVRNPALEGFTLPKILWLRTHEPAAFGRLATVLLAKDFVRYRLTGILSTEPSDASGTLLFDPATMGWSRPLCAAVALPLSLLPDVRGSAEVHGYVSHASATATGLPVGTPVVGGGADNACGAAGVGVLSGDDAVVSWGTSGTVLAPTTQPLVDPGLRVHTFCHVVPDTWYLMGVVLSAGAAFNWFRSHCARELGDDALPLLDREAASIAPGADGVVFLPYLQGERTPHRDASARGAFIGMSLAHTRAHLTRAVLEGVCFALNDSLTILRDLGLSPKQLLLTGGGSRSPLIRQLQSEIFGVPVTTSNREEGPAYGAALLAAVGVGAFPDLVSAARHTIKRAPPVAPDPATVAAYAEPYARFRASFSSSLQR